MQHANKAFETCILQYLKTGEGDLIVLYVIYPDKKNILLENTYTKFWDLFLFLVFKRLLGRSFHLRNNSKRKRAIVMISGILTYI